MDDGQTLTKGAIYKHSDLSKVGETEEFYRDGLFTTGWYTYNISGTVNLEAGTEYVLVLGGTGEGDERLYYDTGTTNQGHYQSQSYGNWPEPLDPTHEDRKYSIYCTYTPS